ncbi:hypothetical protein KEM48_009869 [Puccinia striiformis f. sp. tritici PST-130]|nr:hypothetical protein KEM48_009869 [Puccinia striiformis f. sp. tritici PST-130]
MFHCQSNQGFKCHARSKVENCPSGSRHDVIRTYTYEITVPSAKDFLDGFSAPYELTVSDTYLLGATFTPTLKLTSVQVNVQNNNSTSGGPSSDSNGGKGTSPGSSSNTSDPNGGKAPNSPSNPSDSNSSPIGSPTNSNQPTGGAGGIYPPVISSIFILLTTYMIIV